MSELTIILHSMLHSADNNSTFSTALPRPRSSIFLCAAFLAGLLTPTFSAAQSTPEEIQKRILETVERSRQAASASSAPAESPTTAAIAATPTPAPTVIAPPAPAPQKSAGLVPSIAPASTPTLAPRTLALPQPVQERHLVVRKGKLPAAGQYWDFQRWFQQHAVLSVIVAGDDREQLANVLTKLAVLKEQKVMIGQMILVGAELGPELERGGPLPNPANASRGETPEQFMDEVRHPKPTELGMLGRRLLLLKSEVVDASKYLEKFQISKSPTWIVRYRGQDYVFEGRFDPKQLFSQDGAFLQGEGQNPSGDVIDQYNLLDKKIPIAVHETRAGNKFPKQSAKELVTSEQLMSGQANYFTAAKTRAISYSPIGGELPRAAGLFDGKNRCTRSAVRLDKILMYTEQLEWFDLVYYDFNDAQQSKRASAWELPSAPYLEGDLYNPYRLRDEQQDYGRLFKIRCLPTRVHYLNKDSVPYFEYREGESAWSRE